MYFTFAGGWVGVGCVEKSRSKLTSVEVEVEAELGKTITITTTTILMGFDTIEINLVVSILSRIFISWSRNRDSSDFT